MGERIGNRSGREFMSIGSGDRMRARRRFRASLGIFMAILGLATLLITPAGPTLASIASTSPTPLAPIPTGPCGDKTMRYVDCGNGTVTDTVTGLIWLKQSNCVPTATWEDAKKAAAALKDGACTLSDGSSPGDWRLPTVTEWEATMKNALELHCQPTLTNDAGSACINAGPSSFTGVEADY